MIEVEYRPGWLSWVAATTACLRALGCAVDAADVAGASGYAFHLAISPELCPSGPTMLEWEGLLPAVNALGRGTLQFGTGECHIAAAGNERTRAACREALELARRECAAGRPCVLWGAYIPEFAVVVDVEGDSYLVRSCREAAGQEQPPVPFDALDAPGGPYLLAFPAQAAPRLDALDRATVHRALAMRRAPSWCDSHAYGRPAWEAWIASVREHRALPMGHSYNAACTAEARGFARAACERTAERRPGWREPLLAAADAFGRAATALGRILELMPFPGSPERLHDAQVVSGTVAALGEARDADAAGFSGLERLVA